MLDFFKLAIKILFCTFCVNHKALYYLIFSLFCLHVLRKHDIIKIRLLLRFATLFLDLLSFQPITPLRLRGGLSSSFWLNFIFGSLKRLLLLNPFGKLYVYNCHKFNKNPPYLYLLIRYWLYLFGFGTPEKISSPRWSKEDWFR